jgi:ribonuclease P protein subunit POP4
VSYPLIRRTATVTLFSVSQHHVICQINTSGRCLLAAGFNEHTSAVGKVVMCIHYMHCRMETLNAAKQSQPVVPAKPPKSSKKRPLDTTTPSAAATEAPGLSRRSAASSSPGPVGAGAASNHPYNKLDLHTLPSHLLKHLHLQEDCTTAANITAGGAPSTATSTSSPQPTIAELLESIMVRHMPSGTARHMIMSRTRDKQILLDNPTAALSHVGQKASHRQQLSSKLLPRPKRQAVAELPAEIPPGSLQPLTALWHEYMRRLAGGSGTSTDAFKAKLPEADWHGSCLCIVSSKDSRYLGCSGVVVKDTKQTWVLVSESGRPRVVPKKGCVAKCELYDGNKVFLLGDQLLAAAKQKERKKGR